MSDIFQHVKQQIRQNVPLAPFTTFYLGGPAESFIEVRSESELVDAIGFARHEGMPWFLLGGGSNLVVSDKGLAGLTILNRSAAPDRVDPERGTITLSSGRPLAYAVGLAWRHGLSGFEPFTGIPGTVGGAIFGNAGAYGRCIADLLVEAQVLTPEGRIITAAPGLFGFGYRHSQLKHNGHIVLNATFRATPGDREAIRTAMKEIAGQRHSKHPPREVGSAGSFFKNLDPLPGESRRRAAGEVLEKAGAKLLTVGGASVYARHANFIVNYGKATAEDVKALAGLLKEKVLAAFGIELHEEVIYLGR